MIEALTWGAFEHSESIPEGGICYYLPGGESVGKMTCYEAFPGVIVMYNDFHTDACQTSFLYGQRVISIDHCLEGRIEWEHTDGSFCYLGERDVQISGKEDHVGSYGFPTRHYHGITIYFQLEEAEEGLRPYQGLYSGSLQVLYEKFCRRRDSFILRSNQEIQHIVSELYLLRDRRKINYLRLKVLELLLYLEGMDTNTELEEHSYYPKSTVEKVKAVKEELCRELCCHRTISEYAAQYQISETMLQRCFRSIYGDSLFSYWKKHRLQVAAGLLLETKKSIMEIALDVGYENSGKFITAFRGQYHRTPAKFRREAGGKWELPD